MSKFIYESLNKFLSSGYPGILVMPWDYFLQQINLHEKNFFFKRCTTTFTSFSAAIFMLRSETFQTTLVTNRIASKKVKPRGTRSSDRKKNFKKQLIKM